MHVASPWKTFSLLFKTLGLSLVIVLPAAAGQQFTSSPQQLTVMQGSNVTLPCHLTNLDSLNVFWMHQRTVLSVNQLLMRNNDRYVIRGRYSLVLINVTSQDEGEYTCQVSSSPVLEQVSTVTVTVPAEITDFPESPEVETTLGESVSFTCGATGKPSPNVTWTRKLRGQRSSPQKAEERTGDVSTSTLTIADVRAHHDGLYTCTAFNGVGVPDSSSLHLKVLYPPIFHNQTAVVHTGPGQETYLPCVVSAQPEPQVTWFHNGSRLGLRELPQHKEIVVNSLGSASDYRLRISQVEEDDLGKYVCHVTNSKGEASTEVTLTARPGKPEVVSSRKGDYSDMYTLRWSVVSDVTPLIYHVMLRQDDNTTNGDWREVDVKPSSESQTSRVLEVSVSIPDLSHDTSYEVIVRAHNSYGWSEKSDRFFFTTNSAGVTAPPATLPPTPKKEFSSGKSGSTRLGQGCLWRWVVVATLLAVTASTSVL